MAHEGPVDLRTRRGALALLGAPRPPRAPPLAAAIAAATGQDEDGDTPLHIAVAQGALGAARRLVLLFLQGQRDLDVYNRLRQTPLHLAVITRQPGPCGSLVAHGASPLAPDRLGRSAAHLAAGAAPAACASSLRARPDLGARDYEGLTPLHVAVSAGARESVLLLLEHGADIDAADIKSGRSPLLHAVEANSLEMAELLIQHGAAVNAQSYAGCTALHAAAGRGPLGALRLLLRSGADCALRNNHNETALALASSRQVIDILRGKAARPPPAPPRRPCREAPSSSRALSSGRDPPAPLLPPPPPPRGDRDPAGEGPMAGAGAEGGGAEAAAGRGGPKGAEPGPKRPEPGRRDPNRARRDPNRTRTHPKRPEPGPNPPEGTRTRPEPTRRDPNPARTHPKGPEPGPNPAERTRTGPEPTRRDPSPARTRPKGPEPDPNPPEETRTRPEPGRKDPNRPGAGLGPPWPSAASRCSSASSWPRGRRGLRGGGLGDGGGAGAPLQAAVHRLQAPQRDPRRGRGRVVLPPRGRPRLHQDPPLHPGGGRVGGAGPVPGGAGVERLAGHAGPAGPLGAPGGRGAAPTPASTSAASAATSPSRATSTAWPATRPCAWPSSTRRGGTWRASCRRC
ncbi:LOW QUALITY PROTEIN: B-cell lymphoma 3 protein [Anser cygnoides]|uniref:LOW QUALITY PROTEIN: B-cell lymphoma 3 protein n=1 Tax=Anser cygnoides TaxID=8845 RepID=UPI0034D2E1F8